MLLLKLFYSFKKFFILNSLFCSVNCKLFWLLFLVLLLVVVINSAGKLLFNNNNNQISILVNCLKISSFNF